MNSPTVSEPKTRPAKPDARESDCGRSIVASAPQLLSCTVPGLTFRTGDKVLLTRCIDAWLSVRDGNRTIGYLNPHVYNTACSDPGVAGFLVEADALCVDGVGVMLAVRRYSGEWMPRVVAEQLFNHFLDNSHSCVDAAMIGTSMSEIDCAAKSINEATRAVRVVATLDGYADDASTQEFLQAHKDIPLLLIGAGSPKSEHIATMARQSLRSAVIFHIGGGTIKTWAGTKRRSQPWVSRLGVEWAHRLFFEPHTRSRYTRGGFDFYRNLHLARRRGRLPCPDTLPGVDS